MKKNEIQTSNTNNNYRLVRNNRGQLVHAKGPKLFIEPNKDNKFVAWCYKNAKMIRNVFLTVLAAIILLIAIIFAINSCNNNNNVVATIDEIATTVAATTTEPPTTEKPTTVPPTTEKPTTKVSQKNDTIGVGGGDYYKYEGTNDYYTENKKVSNYDVGGNYDMSSDKDSSYQGKDNDGKDITYTGNEGHGATTSDKVESPVPKEPELPPTVSQEEINNSPTVNLTPKSSSVDDEAE